MAGTKLTEQQLYLLNRIPNSYSIKDKKTKDSKEPVHIAKARKLVKEYDDKLLEQAKQHREHLEKLCAEAREAVYFKPIADALAIVKALEIECSK
jgi:hypothetical protein